MSLPPWRKPVFRARRRLPLRIVSSGLSDSRACAARKADRARRDSAPSCPVPRLAEKPPDCRTRAACCTAPGRAEALPVGRKGVCEPLRKRLSAPDSTVRGENRLTAPQAHKWEVYASEGRARQKGRSTEPTGSSRGCVPRRPLPAAEILPVRGRPIPEERIS